MVTKRNDTIVAKKYYIGEYELTQNVEVPSLKEVTYLSSPTGLVAAEVKIDTVPTFYYILTDHLGSITQLLTAQGSAVGNARFTYDAWGRLRDIRSTNPYMIGNDQTIAFHILDRGYCGHEHLLEHNIINMNGRIYDPITAQFMQADNYIQTPEDYIGYNRYSYCRHNPFKYTDPSGEMWQHNGYNKGGCGMQIGDDFGNALPTASFSQDEMDAMHKHAVFMFGVSKFKEAQKAAASSTPPTENKETKANGDTETNGVGGGTQTSSKDGTTTITFTDIITGEKRTFNVPELWVDEFNNIIDKFGTLPSFEQMEDLNTDPTCQPNQEGWAEYEVASIFGDDNLFDHSDRVDETRGPGESCSKAMEDLIGSYEKLVRINWFIHSHPGYGYAFKPSHPDRDAVNQLQERLGNPNINGILEDFGAFCFYNHNGYGVLPRGYHNWEKR